MAVQPFPAEGSLFWQRGSPFLFPTRRGRLAGMPTLRLSYTNLELLYSHIVRLRQAPSVQNLSLEVLNGGLTKDCFTLQVQCLDGLDGIVREVSAAATVLLAESDDPQPDDPHPEASTLGKYTGLLATVYAPDVETKYGIVPPRDWGWWEGGWWEGSQYPAGYWVYQKPWWYVWERQAYPATTSMGTQVATPINLFTRRTLTGFVRDYEALRGVTHAPDFRLSFVEVLRGALRGAFWQLKRPKRRRKHFGPSNQTWPDWVTPGASLRSLDPEYPGVAMVLEVHAESITLNWRGQVCQWRLAQDWFHDQWQYEETPPTFWERLRNDEGTP
jgi:hypothetical protein